MYHKNTNSVDLDTNTFSIANSSPSEVGCQSGLTQVMEVWVNLADACTFFALAMKRRAGAARERGYGVN